MEQKKRAVSIEIIKQLFDESGCTEEQVSPLYDKMSYSSISIKSRTTNEFPKQTIEKSLFDKNAPPSYECDDIEIGSGSNLQRPNSILTNLDHVTSDIFTDQHSCFNISKPIRMEDKRESIIKYLETYEACELPTNLDSLTSVNGTDIIATELRNISNGQIDSDVPISLRVSFSDSECFLPNNETLGDPAMSLYDEMQIAKTDLSQVADRVEKSIEDLPRTVEFSDGDQQLPEKQTENELLMCDVPTDRVSALGLQSIEPLPAAGFSEFSQDFISPVEMPILVSQSSKDETEKIDVPASFYEDKNTIQTISPVVSLFDAGQITKTDQLQNIDQTEKYDQENSLKQVTHTEHREIRISQFVETLEHLRINSSSEILRENDQCDQKKHFELAFQPNQLSSSLEQTSSALQCDERIKLSAAKVNVPNFAEGNNSQPNKSSVFLQSAQDKTEKIAVAASASEDNDAKTAQQLVLKSIITPEVTHASKAKKKKVRFNTKTLIFGAGRGKSKTQSIVKDHRYPQSSQMRVIYRSKCSINTKASLNSIGVCSAGDDYDVFHISDDGDSTFENLFHQENIPSTSTPSPNPIKKLVENVKKKKASTFFNEQKTVGIQTDQQTHYSYSILKQNHSQSFTDQEQQTENSLDNDIRTILQQTVEDFQKEGSFKHKTKNKKSNRKSAFELTDIKDAVRTVVREEFRKAFPRRQITRIPTPKPRRIIVKKQIVVKSKPTASIALQIKPATTEIGVNTPKKFPRLTKPKKRTNRLQHVTNEQTDTTDEKKPERISTEKKKINRRTATNEQIGKIVENQRRTLAVSPKRSRSTETAGSSEMRHKQQTLSQCLKTRQPVDRREESPDPLEVPETPSQSDIPKEFTKGNQQKCTSSQRSSLSVLDLKHSKGCFRIPALHFSVSPSNGSPRTPLSTSYYISETDALTNQDVEQLNAFYCLVEQMRLSTQTTEASSPQMVPNSQQSSSAGKRRSRRAAKGTRKSLRPYPTCPKLRASTMAENPPSSESQTNEEPSLLSPIPVGPPNDPQLYPDELMENIGKNFIILYLNRKLPELYEETQIVATRRLHRNLIKGRYNFQKLRGINEESDESTSDEEEEQDNEYDFEKYKYLAPFCSSVKSSQELHQFSPGISSIASHDCEERIELD